MKSLIVLKDGIVLHGRGFGAKTTTIGELVFNTSMVGYQEALTDPSYAGQILLMTYPLIGNYGTNKEYRESETVHPRGFAVRELSDDYEHRQATDSLDGFLKDNGVPGIQGIDTRQAVRKLRNSGVMPCIISNYEGELDINVLVKKLEFDYSAVDFVSQVTTKAKQVFNKGARKRVALIDYGVKMGIVRQLVSRGAEVHMFPSFCTAKDIESVEPEGVLLSNGPGDPSKLTFQAKTIRDISGKFPILGVCLGNQLIAHAFGGNTYKLKFGHRGSNHAVLDKVKNRVVITTQNHGFAVGKIPEGFEVTHININDKSVEGLRNIDKQIFSVQYHPEAAPGPHDSRYLFDDFFKMM